MNNKKIKMFFSIIIIIIMLGSAGFYITTKLQNNKVEYNEYTPQEEISDEQFRSTVVKLYFLNKSTGELEAENRNIDAKILISDPCISLLNLLIEGPENTSLSKTIPDGTKINKVTLQGDMAILDFSKEFIDNHTGGTIEESNTIYSIVNTLTQLTEINSIKITIDGTENLGFKDNYINFIEPFVKK